MPTDRNGLVSFLCAFFAALLLHVLLIECIKIDRCQNQLREAAAHNGIRYHFTRIREKNIWAEAAKHLMQLIIREAVDHENTCLMYFDKKSGFFTCVHGSSD